MAAHCVQLRACAHQACASCNPHRPPHAASHPALQQDLGVDPAPQLRTLAVEEPAKRKGGVVLGSPAELVDRLRNEAKVI